MNWRYFYIASVVALSYVLFLSWNAEKEIKQEVAEATAIDISKNQQVDCKDKSLDGKNLGSKA